MKVFLVGGFLGSGKTTAIRQAVSCLQKAGREAGVVTNDQGDQLVDTRFLRLENIAVKEVTEGCFCCNYQDLDKSIRSLDAEMRPDAVFAESVGSCTDLVATVIRPLLHFNDRNFEVVLSVFADVRLLCLHLQKAGHIFNDNVYYIFEKQLEEADILVVNKIDLLSGKELKRVKKLIEEAYEGKTIVYLNALSEEYIQHWVNILFSYERGLSTRSPLQIDYDRYSEGEAELAWLEGEIGIDTTDKSAVKTGVALINRIYAQVLEQGYPIGHLKFLLSDGYRQKKISFTSVERGEYKLNSNDADSDRVVVLINARVQTHPGFLKRIVEDSILESELLKGCRITEGRWSGFKPDYPRPTHRMN